MLVNTRPVFFGPFVDLMSPTLIIISIKSRQQNSIAIHALDASTIGKYASRPDARVESRRGALPLISRRGQPVLQSFDSRVNVFTPYALVVFLFATACICTLHTVYKIHQFIAR